MSLVRPILNPITAFDATDEYIVTFSASGGDEITGNELKITTNDIEPIVVYDNTISSSSLEHTIPAETLTNGIYYLATVRTFNSQNQSSEWSYSMGFYCFTTPTLELNIIDGTTVTTDSVDVYMTYNQAEEEKMNYGVIDLYNANGTVLIQSSGTIYVDTDTTPPNTLYFPFAVDNDTSYTLVGRATTVHGTVVTDVSHFTVSYSTHSGDYFYVITNNCNGEVEINSEGIVTYTSEMPINFHGIVYGDENDFVLYDGKSYANLVSLDGMNPYEDNVNSSFANVSWSNIGFSSNFLLGVSVIPALIDNEILRITDTYSAYNDYISISINRGATQDYLTITASNGTHIDKALGMFCNGHSYINIYLKVIDNVLTCETYNGNDAYPHLSWNDDNNNNVYHSMTSNVVYRGENGGTYSPQSPTVNSFTNEDFNTITIGNGLFSNLVLSTNPYENNNDVFTQNPSNILYWQGDSWDNLATGDFSKATLERGFVSENPLYGSNALEDEYVVDEWNLIDTYNLEPDTVNYVRFSDKYIPTGIVAYKFKIYDSLNNVAYESIVFFKVKWNYVFISDVDKTFRLQSGVIYSNHTQNIQNNILMPIGAKYPFVIQNANSNYRSGALQFLVLGYEFDNTYRLDRISMTKELNDVIDFLTNTKPKVIKDFNGNIYVCRVVNSPQISYDANWGNNIPKVSFDWVEQAKYDDINAMKKLGFYS